jgi:hypothetical protein
VTNVQIIIEGCPPVEFDASEITLTDRRTGVTLTATRTEPVERREIPTGEPIAGGYRMRSTEELELLQVEMRPPW